MRECSATTRLFDVSCYSCELGAAEPDLAFLTEAARRIGAETGAILFIDDNAENVAAARDRRLSAEHGASTTGTTSCTACSRATRHRASRHVPSSA